MGAIFSLIEKGIAGIANGFANGIGKAFKAGLTDPVKTIADGIGGMTNGAGAEFEAYRNDLKPWFNAPEKVVKEMREYRIGFSKWFDMPEKLTPDINALTSIVVHLSEPVYALVIILCTLASIIILRYLFKFCMDSLNAWFALDWNEKNEHKRKPRRIAPKKQPKPGFCSRFLCCCCSCCKSSKKKEIATEDAERFSVYVEEQPTAAQVPTKGTNKVDEMVEKYEMQMLKVA